MEKLMLPGKNGYQIAVNYQLPAQTKLVVLLCHGFGSSKDNTTAQAMTAELQPRGIGTVSFDLPAHGESPVGGEQLRIDNCLDDIATVEALVHRLAPQAEIGYFGSSFGSYLTALYLATRPHSGQRALLRCAAVTMPQLFWEDQQPQYTAQMEQQGYFTMEEYERPLDIYRGFMDDLLRYDAFALCNKGFAQVMMIHGDADDVAPIEAARRFAEQVGAEFLTIHGAGHRFQGEGETEQLVAAAAAFLTAE